MISIAVGLLLIVSLLLAHFWAGTERLSKEGPLDIDASLPAPWAGHASSIFSLTALFGAYLAILVIVGPSALLGVAAGGVGGLVFLRRVISNSNSPSFEHFLATRRFSTDSHYNEFFFILLAITQAGLAISEVVILRDLAVHAFALAPRHATVFALSIALVAYLYCLVGGYGAVFRTDLLQFGFIAAMCIGIAAVSLPTLSTASLRSMLSPLSLEYWTFASLPPLLMHVLNIAIGFLTGACFLVASPDTWKRVFLISRDKSQSAFRILAIAGGIPFILLLPAALLVPKVSLDSLGAFDVISQASPNRFLLLVITLGMISAFLSSFDSAFIASVHVILVNKARRAATPGNIASFHYTAGTCFAAIVAGSLALISALGNCYFLAAYLLSLYAILGGSVIGTRGLSRPASTGKVPWLTFCILALWFVYLNRIPHVLKSPNPEQIKAFMPGMFIFLFYAISTFVRSRSTGVGR